MATPLHPDPSRRLRPVTTSEVREMRALAEDGWSATRIGLAFDRRDTVVQRHCRDVLRPRRRISAVLAYAEAKQATNEMVARHFGYANAQSAAAILYRARKRRAAGVVS